MALQPTFDIRPIREEHIEQILLDELTPDDIDAIRFSAEEGEQAREIKWAAILPRLISRLRDDLKLAEDPTIVVEKEPDLVDIQLPGPKLRVFIRLLRIR